MNAAVRIASTVIGKADRKHPADAVLRLELKNARGVSREQGRDISRAVFAYYRWLGWLNEDAPVEQRLAHALELDETFQKDPGAIPESELSRAAPAWITEHLEASPEWLRGLQADPKLWLRAKLGQGSELAKKLGRVCRQNPALPEALFYEGKADLFRIPEFHAGEFELQDLSSQMVGAVCHPQPGETWWDACAGEGGKTLHLCDLMRGRGLVWASDRAEWRLEKLKRRAARAKAFNYRAVLWENNAELPTKTKFDGILVDAPCSGTGTWQRNPQARWTTTPEDVTELAALQKELLVKAASALKPGGRLIYSVCTLTRAETVEVQRDITARFPELQAEELKNPLQPDGMVADSITLLPQKIQGNGMFICSWRKAVT